MKVAVVGGGISGLTAADYLADSGAEVVLLDASPVLGGKLRTASVAGVDLDVGAESAIVRGGSLTMAELITALGLETVRPTGARSAVYVDGRLVPVPPQVLGVPYEVDQLGELLTASGLDRARREPDLAAPALEGDVAIGRLVADRFGDEVVDRLLEPML
ncbi:MAG: FAD-dependent oxidoreductase, partial [Propionibacteriales bacterium]|nr:FAD-dependent oxidoreductase [Propionibacteriales bacterium]